MTQTPEATEASYQPLEEYLVDGDRVLVPLDRSDVKHVKAVKFTEEELAKIEKFQTWLAITISPLTGQPFIAKDEFSALIQFSLNLAFRVMARAADEMDRAERSEE